MMLFAWAVWLIPLASVPFVALLGRWGHRAVWAFSTASVLASFIAALYGALTLSASSEETLTQWLPGVSIPLQVNVDGLSVIVATLVTFLSLLVVVYSLGYMNGEEGLVRYYSLILLFVGGMLGLVMAGNLIQFYFFWEIVGVCSALLIAFWSDRESARRAGMKAFLVTRVGDASLLVAVLLLFGWLGSTSYTSVLSSVGTPRLSGSALHLVGVLVLIGAMGKSAQVPLHTWLPDAMEGPTTVSALIHAATMVNAGVYLILRLFPLFSTSAFLSTLVLIVGLLSTFVGGACAVAADDIKRVLAYSTISQLGLMFVAIGVGTWTGALFHLVSQGLFKALAFLAAGSVITSLGTRKIDEMGGLWRKMKITYVGFFVSMFAMSGLPPLVGFWSKDAILGAALQSNLAAAVLLALASVLTGAYGFRVLIRVFHGPPARKEVRDPGPSMLVPIIVLTVSVIVGWMVLQGQQLVSVTLMPSPDLLTTSTTLLALAAALLPIWYLFSLKREATLKFSSTNKLLSTARATLLEGLGFDRLYAALVRSLVMPLSRLTSKLQTGILNVDTALLAMTFVVLIVLVAAGVL